MNPATKLSDKLRQDGVRRTAAAAMHRMASALDQSKTGDSPQISPAWTEYLSWITYAVPGMLTKGNVDCISHALKNLPNGAPMLEIGSFCGLSTCLIDYFRHKHSVSNRLYTSDKWAFEGQALGENLGDHQLVTHDQYRTFIRESFIRNTGMFCKSDLPATIEVDSDTFFDLWTAGGQQTDVFGRVAQMGGELSFCYIDGNHTYEFAKRDFENTDRFLSKGGFILFDDSSDGSGWGVCQVVEEVLKSGSYELIARNPNYLVRKRS